MLCWMSAVAHSVLLSYIFATETKSEQVTLYINSFYKFDSTSRNIFPNASRLVQSSFQIKMSLLLIKCGIITATVFPIFFNGRHWRNPCKVTLLGFGLISECQCSVAGVQIYFPLVSNILLKIFIFLVNHSIWSFGMQTGLFGIAIITTLSIISLHQLIDR